MTTTPISSSQSNIQRPDNQGRYGRFGGKYVPETLMPALAELESAYEKYRQDSEFQAELQQLLHDYVGRPSPLYFA
ncbi:MAG: tryptophan synthase subunit beta, partial [Cyanobacteria bacterium P01_A01_bin.84]